MAFLTIGGTLYEAQHDGASQNESDYAGERSRAFSGLMRSGRRIAKRNWSFTMIPLSETDYLSLVAAVGIDVALSVSGDFTNNVAVTAFVEVTQANYIPTGATFMRVAQIAITEV